MSVKPSTSSAGPSNMSVEPSTSSAGPSNMSADVHELTNLTCIEHPFRYYRCDFPECPAVGYTNDDGKTMVITIDHSNKVVPSSSSKNVPQRPMSLRSLNVVRKNQMVKLEFDVRNELIRTSYTPEQACFNGTILTEIFDAVNSDGIIRFGSQTNDDPKPPLQMLDECPSTRNHIDSFKDKLDRKNSYVMETESYVLEMSDEETKTDSNTIVISDGSDDEGTDVVWQKVHECHGFCMFCHSTKHEKKFMAYPCGHSWICETCATKKTPKCMKCDTPVQHFKRIIESSI